MSEKTGLLSRKQARVLCGDGQSFSSFQQLARGHPPRGNDVHPLSIVEIERLHISTLVADGLDPHVQQVLDIVRVVGNNAVHPGQIDLRDDRATAEMLFGFLNVIAEKTISVPKRIEEVYGALPEDARDAITKRDANT